jgi:hypothetical protein
MLNHSTKSTQDHPFILSWSVSLCFYVHKLWYFESWCTILIIKIYKFSLQGNASRKGNNYLIYTQILYKINDELI